MRTTTRFHRSLTALATVGVVAGLALGTAPAAQAHRSGHSGPAEYVAGKAVGHHVTQAEARQVGKVSVERLNHEARPASAPYVEQPDLRMPRNGADGAAITVRGQSAGEAPRGIQASSAGNDGALWPYAATANPNRMVGVLYFDTDPSPSVTSIHQCTGTVVNSPNGSTVIVAGHCVWDSVNRRWYTNVQFVPATENGSAPYGVWPVRYMSTTGNYYSSALSADDMAAVVVNRDSQGRTLQSRVGSQGISFNQPVGQWRTSLGYPVTDQRWPGWVSSGKDMYYCQNTDTYYSSGTWAGQMWLPCRMTGGASGGPWLTGTNTSWIGYLNSVNSNKGYADSRGSGWMFGPYFGTAEANVWNAVKSS